MDMRLNQEQDELPGRELDVVTEDAPDWHLLCAQAASEAGAEQACFVFFQDDPQAPAQMVGRRFRSAWQDKHCLTVWQQQRFYCALTGGDIGFDTNTYCHYLAVPVSRGQLRGLLLLEYLETPPVLVPSRRRGLDILATHGALLWRERERNAHQRRRESSSRRLLRRLKGLFSQVPILINGFNSQGRCILWNDECERVFGWSFDELRQHPAPISLFYPDPEELRRVMETFGTHHSSEFREWRPFDRKGRRLTTQWANIMLPNGDMLCVGHDISEQKDIENQLRLAASVFEFSYDGIMLTDAGNHVTHVNPAFTRITGYLSEEVVGRSPDLLRTEGDEDGFVDELRRHLKTRDYWQGECHCRRKNGEAYSLLLAVSVVRDDEGQVLHHAAIFSDITYLKEHEAELKRQACHDVLTRIPNRLLFGELLDRAISSARRSEGRLAVCYLDLDGFKQINDSRGHAAGDRLLIEISTRLGLITRSCDALARLGGDEFALLFTGLHNDLECDEILDRVLAVINEPLELDGERVRVSASIGVALYPQDADDAELLLRHADQAMYQAKKQGKNAYVFFDAELHLHEHQRQQQLTQLIHAFREGEFLLYYQPKIDLTNRRMIGLEALLRWQHPQRGIVAPAEFLSIIIGSAMEFDLGRWVIEQVLKQMTYWCRQGMEYRISFNVSSGQLMHPDFIDELTRLLALYPMVSPSLLELEFQEGAVLADLHGAVAVLERCRLLGLSISFDDFGTGYSSLSHLNRLPVDIIKIDRRFICDLLSNAHDVSMVESVVQLAAALRMAVIAEGMEQSAQGDRLQQLGCHYVQGYGISRPMPAEQVESWLQAWNDRLPPP
ncbi:putative bifunctional diguanylate cyclase/phosphodiesterase [Oceanisphaera sp. KMM 10153]|uniref:putative bifunctional diguanylate cyclase/phosphodiesterase n=1 Tax=Oceanisphaera submarina TaxID=3390193 RepID=UPI0039768693